MRSPSRIQDLVLALTEPDEELQYINVPPNHEGPLKALAGGTGSLTISPGGQDPLMPYQGDEVPPLIPTDKPVVAPPTENVDLAAFAPTKEPVPEPKVPALPPMRETTERSTYDLSQHLQPQALPEAGPPLSPDEVPQRQIPRPRDFSGDVRSLRDQTDQLRFGEALTLAGAQANAALTGQKTDPTASKVWGGRAEELEGRLAQDMNLDRLRVKDEREYQALDPASARNEQYQMMFERISPDVAELVGGPAIISQMTEPELQGLLKFFTGRADAQSKLAIDKLKMLKSQGLADRNFDQKERHHADKMAAVAAGREGIQGRHGDNFLDKVIKGSQDLAPAITTLHEIEKTAPGMIFGKVPANDSLTLTEWQKIAQRFPKGVASQFTPEVQTRLASATRMFKALVRFPITGANLTDSERAEWERIFQDAELATPEAQATVLDMFRQTLGRRVRAKQGPYEEILGDDLADRLLMRGGISYKDPIFKDVAVEDRTKLPSQQGAAAPGAQGPAGPAKPRRLVWEGKLLEEQPDGSMKVIK